MFTSLRATENFHIVLWLLKDLCWVMIWKPLGLALFVPTLAWAIWIAWRLRSDTCELLHSLAVVCWIMANGLWMITEFWFAEEHRILAAPFFVLGLALVAWYYMIIQPRSRRVKQA